jgi:methyltransferase
MEIYVVLSAILLQKVSDLRRHVLNRKFLFENGGKISQPSLTLGWLVADWFILILAIAEWRFLQTTVPFGVMVAAAGILIIAFALKIWVRFSLGALWTFDLIVVPGVSRVVTGPYRFFPHTDYLARVLEAVAIAIFFGAYYSLGIYCGFLCLILPAILGFERRQLELMSY